LKPAFDDYIACQTQIYGKML